MKKNEIKNYQNEVIGNFIANLLLPKKGQMTNKEITDFINTHKDKLTTKLNCVLGTINDVRIREIINLIRRDGICKTGEIISNSNGYWISNDRDEIDEYIQSWELRLASQVNAIKSMNKSLDKYPKTFGKTVTPNKCKKDLFETL